MMEAVEPGVYHAIADPTRRAILALLREGERSVNAIVERLRGSQSAISQHLAVLRRAGLVVVRPMGRRRIYALRAEPLMEVHDWVAHFDRFWTQGLDRLGTYLRDTHGEADTSHRGGVATPLDPKGDLESG